MSQRNSIRIPKKSNEFLRIPQIPAKFHEEFIWKLKVSFQGILGCQMYVRRVLLNLESYNSTLPLSVRIHCISTKFSTNPKKSNEFLRIPQSPVKFLWCQMYVRRVLLNLEYYNSTVRTKYLSFRSETWYWVLLLCLSLFNKRENLRENIQQK